MRSIKERSIKDSRGVAMPLALVALVSLLAFLLVFLYMAGRDPAASANFNDTTSARYMAETGLEWAFDQVMQQVAQTPNSDFKGVVNAILAAPTNGVMATGMSLAGLPATSVFSVTVRNDNLPNDNQITGQPVDPNAGQDTNNVIILTATGSFNGANRQIQQVLSHLDLNPPGAVNLPGLGTNTSFEGNAFTITGNDTMLNGDPGTCPSVWGISVRDTPTETLVQSSLSAQQKNNVAGKPQVAGPGEGDNTIAPDLSMTPAQITKFVDAVKPYADLSLEASGSSQLDYQNLGNTCSTSLSDPNCWGTSSNPKIIYVKGSLDPAQAFYALRLSGNSTGAGILIIEDGDLSITGDFRWEGLILITGKYVGLRYGGGGYQDIYGGVVVNETANANSEVEFDSGGHAKIYYSCEALNKVKNMRQLTRLGSWREL